MKIWLVEVQAIQADEFWVRAETPEEAERIALDFSHDDYMEEVERSAIARRNPLTPPDGVAIFTKDGVE